MENYTQVFDVIVIGAGVMGSATAYQTAKRGLKTLLLEQFDFLHHRGSSHGESRTIRASYTKPYYCSMVLQSSPLWEEAEAEVGYKVYFKTNHLDIGPSNCKFFQTAIDSCRKNSIPVRVLDRNEVSEEFSGRFQLPEGWIGVVTPHGGVIKATKAVAMFQTLGVQNGAMLKDNAGVVDIKKDQTTGDIIVYTNGSGTFRSRKCVITAGPWTRKLIETARGITLPIQPLETAAYYWKVNEGHEEKFTIESGFPTFGSHGEAHVFGTPSLEFPGLIKIPIDEGSACEPEERTWAAQPGLLGALREWIKGRFGGLVDSDEPVITHSCMYSMTPDGDYVIDFLGGEFAEDVVVAGGFSGHGFKMAPLVGRVAAELVASGTAEGVDLSYFRVARFEGSGVN
ncbi:FAD-dependent oxidoreductase family protein [Perilla frutescens var. hirtella]|nr:FAD-dependent oxidoreductase family protein [Perilla frutescens var. hirtella]